MALPSRGGGETTQRRRGPVVLAATLIALLAVASVALWIEVRQLDDDLAGVESRLEENTRSVEGLGEQAERLELSSFDPAAVAERVRPSVFAVEAPVGGSAFTGTAFAMASQGRRSLLVTNFHVIEPRWRLGARTVSVSRGFRRYEGRIVQVRPSEDLALLIADAELPLLSPAATPAAVGDPVAVIGSAEGLEGTLTTGVVSAVDRRVEGLRWLQFSAPVNPGNSGGPVVDRRGDVVGVATFKAVGIDIEGLSFAIPLERVCESLGVCEDD